MVTEEYTITTIKLEKETKNRLEKLKIHRRESYDEVLRKLLKILNVLKVNPGQARFRLTEIERIRNRIAEK